MKLYDSLVERTEGIKDGVWRCRTGAGTGSSVHVKRDGDDMIATVSGNEILRVTPAGTITLDSCGWHTRTTSMAWNLCLRGSLGSVYSHKHRYYFAGYGGGTPIPLEQIVSGIYRSPRETLTLEDRP